LLQFTFLQPDHLSDLVDLQPEAIALAREADGQILASS